MSYRPKHLGTTRDNLIERLVKHGVHRPFLQTASESWMRDKLDQIQRRGRVSFNPRRPRVSR